MEIKFSSLYGKIGKFKPIVENVKFFGRIYEKISRNEQNYSISWKKNFEMEQTFNQIWKRFKLLIYWQKLNLEKSTARSASVSK